MSTPEETGPPPGSWCQIITAPGVPHTLHVKHIEPCSDGHPDGTVTTLFGEIVRTP